MVSEGFFVFVVSLSTVLGFSARIFGNITHLKGVYSQELME